MTRFIIAWLIAYTTGSLTQLVGIHDYPVLFVAIIVIGVVIYWIILKKYLKLR